MTMTDPIADMLTRVRNANSAYHDRVSMPSSKLKTHSAELLPRERHLPGGTRPTSQVPQGKPRRERPQGHPE